YDSSVSPETSEQINLRCEDTPASDITDDTSNSDICQRTKTQLEKFMVEVSENSSSSINNSNADSNVIPTTLNETEESKTQCFTSSQPSNISLAFYTKTFGLASEKQLDPESNAVNRILNKEVRAQHLANISDALLWKRIEKAKRLNELFSVIDMDKFYRIHSFSADSISKMTNKDIQYIIYNVTFDYSIKIEPTLKSEFPEP
ncbi:6020_t:CDS:2, partial [Acaulospora morrowiae]